MLTKTKSDEKLFQKNSTIGDNIANYNTYPKIVGENSIPFEKLTGVN